MSEILQSEESFWDYRDGLSALRDESFVRAHEKAEEIVLSSQNKRREAVEEQSAFLDNLYMKLCGHPTKNQKVFVRCKALYPMSEDQVKSGKQYNHFSDQLYAPRTPKGDDKFIENEFILDGILMPRIYDKYQAAFKLRPANASNEPTVSHYYVTFKDIFRLDFMEQFTVNMQGLPRKLEEMEREAYLFFQTAGFSETDPKQQRQTAERVQRSMTKKLQPLIDTRTNLMLSTPLYYSETDYTAKAPEISDTTRHDSSETDTDIIVGRALGIAIKRDSEEPYPYKPFFVMRNDVDNKNYAVPTDQSIEVFTL